MKAILIDPEARTVKQVDVDYDGHSLEGFYKILGCDLVEIVRLTSVHTLVIDEEGLLKPNYHFSFPDSKQPFSGKACLLGMDREGEFVGLNLRPNADIIMQATMLWHGDDDGLEQSINKNKTDRPESSFASMDENMNPIEATRKVLWQWSPNRMRS